MYTETLTRPRIEIGQPNFDELFIEGFGPSISTELNTSLFERELLERARAVQFAEQRLQNTELRPQQRHDLLQFVQMGNDARYQLIRAYMKQVNAAAQRYRVDSLPFEVIIQEGNLGLLTAIDSFDLDGDRSFADHAAEHINQAIENVIAYSQNHFESYTISQRA